MRTLHLIESAHKGHSTNGLHSLLSMTAHATLVVAALYATARETVEREREPEKRVYFAPELPKRAHAQAAPSTPALERPPQREHSLPEVMPPLLRLPIDIPPVGVPLPGPGAPDFQERMPGMEGPPGVSGTPAPERSGPFAAEEVESPAAALSKLGPKYPARALSLGLSGSVTARFIVGADGRVEPDIQILQATTPDFASAVRDFLRQSRFRAARVGGRPVRQLVEQRFVFELRR